MQRVKSAVLMAVLFVCTVSATNLYAQNNTKAPPTGATAAADKTAGDQDEIGNKIEAEFDNRKKDPLLAGVLSWYTPGLGQLYAEAPLKGAGYFILESSLFLAAFFSIADLNVVADTDIGLNVGVTFKKNEFGEIPESNKNIAITFLVMGVALHIWNVVDAINTTSALNSKIYRDLEIRYNKKSAKVNVNPAGLQAKTEEQHFLSVHHRF